MQTLLRELGNGHLSGNQKKSNGSATDKADDSADPRIPTEIGERLKELYESVVEEEIPDRFLDLLDQLDKSEKSK